jgi:long-chain acyl-CoA synthetase
MDFERVWHKSYPVGTPNEVTIEKLTMPEALDRSVLKFPNNPAMVYMGKTISYLELDSLVNRFANALIALGVKPGDKVGMILPNMPQAIIANFATLRIGGVTAMNNPLYTERELEYQLNDSDATVLVTLDLLFPRVIKIQASTKVKKIITCHINDFFPFPTKQLFPFVKKGMYRKDTSHENTYAFMDLIKKYPETKVENKASWDNTAALIYTGGTTGVSKGAQLTHANLSSVVQQFSAWLPELGFGDLERILGVYPIFHSAGYSVSQTLPIWNAWSVVLVPRPDPVVICDMLKKFKPTFLPGVPTIFVGLLNHKPFREMNLSFVKGYFGGAAPLSQDTLNQLKDLHGATINDVYGATENTAFASCMPWKGNIKYGSVGVPIPNTDIKIVDLETGTKELEQGQEGEICIKGPQVMKGYYKKPEATAEAIKDGWFYLGDIGTMDEDGYLTIIDRKSDMIIAGGFNIYPQEIDEVLMNHPQILEACAIGVSDTYRGETVKAYVVIKPGQTLSEKEVIDYCRKNLAAYKAPRGIVFVDELPKTAVGKILRREIKRIDEEQAAKAS